MYLRLSDPLSGVRMELARYANILGMRTKSGRLLGFHVRNMEVAELSPAAWSALQAGPRTSSEARAELEAWNQEIDPLTVDVDIPQQVHSLSVNVIQACNLKCVYCAAGGDGSYGETLKQIDIETIEEQIRSALQSIPFGDEFVLTFFGGEPLLVPDTVRRLARFAKSQAAERNIRMRFKLFTNGTNVTPDAAEMLAEIGCHVVISLDGPPEVHDRNRATRGGTGSSARALNGLERLMKVRDRLGSLSAGSVFGKHNTDVLSAYKYLRPFEFDSLKFDFAADTDDGEASQAYMRSLAATAEYAFSIGGERELRRISLFDSYFRVLDQRTRLHNHCGAGKSHFATDGRGRIVPCQWFVGRESEEIGRGFAIDQEKLQAYAPRLNELNNCASCWARHLCGGGCMYVNQLKNGSKHVKDKNFCDRTRYIIAKVIELYAEARLESEGKYETH